MIHEFTFENVATIGEVLGSTPSVLGNDVVRFDVRNSEQNRRLALEIHLGLEVDGKRINMVSVYAHNTFIQLHNCTAFVVSDFLNQVTFFGKTGDRTTGLIVEKEAGCSIYANVDERILTGDFTKLPEDLMMCGVALSLTDTDGLDKAGELDDFSSSKDKSEPS